MAEATVAGEKGWRERLEIMNELPCRNEWWWRLACTVAQGVLGVTIANLDLLVGT